MKKKCSTVTFPLPSLKNWISPTILTLPTLLFICFCILGLLSLRTKQGGIITLRADSYHKTLKDYKLTLLAPSQKKMKTENNHPAGPTYIHTQELYFIDLQVNQTPEYLSGVGSFSYMLHSTATQDSSLYPA